MFDLGIPELIMVLVVALVVFGPGRLPEIGAKLGKAIRDFRGATQSISDEIESVTKLEPEDEATTKRILAEKAEAEAQAQAKAAESPSIIQETPLPAGLAPMSEPQNTIGLPQTATNMDGDTAFPAETPGIASDVSSAQAELAPIAATVETAAPAEGTLAEEPLPPELAAALAAGDEQSTPAEPEPEVERPRASVTVVRRTIAESLAEEALTAAAPAVEAKSAEPSA